jgi:WD40 repeat protein
MALKPRMESDWNACLQTLEGHGGWVRSVVFSPDGQRLVSGSDDNTVKIWDVATGVCIQTVDIGRSLYRLSFNPATNSLSTDIGLLNLDHQALPPVIDDRLINTTSEDNCHSSWGISTDGMWIIQDSKQMLWLPPDYRQGESAIVGSTVAIGSRSGGPHRDTPRRASTPERVGVRIMSALNLACRNCALMQFLLLRIL